MPEKDLEEILRKADQNGLIDNGFFNNTFPELDSNSVATVCVLETYADDTPGPASLLAIDDINNLISNGSIAVLPSDPK